MRKMERSKCHNFLFVLPLVVALLHLVNAQSDDQSDFISLDCGLPENSTYSEKGTQINYISDAAFISTGVSKSISPKYRAVYQQQMAYLRSFPEGTRNCYKIGVTKGTKYLIRTSFLYGDYDNFNKTPRFDLHLGANFWDTVSFASASVGIVKEIIHTPPRDTLHLCLVNVGSGTPIIQSIELRPLKNTTYVIDDSSALKSFARLDLGSTTNVTYRFPFDSYDRSWSPHHQEEWTQLPTALTVDLQSHNDYWPPNSVMKNAAIPKDEATPLEFYLEPLDVSEEYYFYVHVAELEKLKPNESRAFNINVNGKYFYGPVVPSYLSTTTIYSTKALTGKSNYSFSIEKLENSTLPPTLNAIEFYTRLDFSLSETYEDDVIAINSIKTSYGVERNSWNGDPCVPVKYLWTGLNCSDHIFEPPRIISLNLSSSGLTGDISENISKLTMIESLDLSNNNLTGPVPDFLASLTKLRVLNLKGNNFTGSVPDALMEKSKDGSLLLSFGEDDATSSQNKKKRNKSIVIPIAASVSGLVVLLLIAGVIFLGLRKKNKQGVSTSAIVNTLEPTIESETRNRQFTYSEVIKMTNNFERILGKGGFGTVYYGLTDNSTPVAVKMLSSSSIQGLQEFQAEVRLLLRVHHRNLTSLVGYCNEGTNRALIYEYMDNGDLDSHLSGKSRSVLSWEGRLQIAIDAAQGLEYLHNGCKPPIVHRDVKTTNILLADNFQAKIADFGLSRIFPTDGGTHVSTIVAGTPGYLDPGYYSTSRLNEKSDVYSFGVVLLQIITSKPAIISTSHERTHISQWVNGMVENGDIKGIVDPKLNGDFEIHSVWKAVEISMACVFDSPSKRPNMNQVVSELNECLATERARTNNNSRTMDSANSMSSMTTIASDINPVAR